MQMTDKNLFLPLASKICTNTAISADTVFDLSASLLEGGRGGDGLGFLNLLERLRTTFFLPVSTFRYVTRHQFLCVT